MNFQAQAHQKDFQPRYDEKRGIYRDCKWCGGKGCLACPAEADAEYNRQFPDGPKPLASFKTDDPEEMQKALASIGGPALEKAFGEGGGGVAEIIENLRRVGKLQE